MIRLLYYSILFVSAVEMFQQHDYLLTYERLEVSGYNKQYVRFAKTHNFKHNRTYTATNMTLFYNVDFRKDLKIQVQAYKFASNEYRLFPMSFTINLCEAISKDEFGFQNFYYCGNFTKCPMVKGKYTICNWAPDEKKYPPYIPEGSYMLDLKYVYFAHEVYGLQMYATVKKPMK